MKVQAADVGLTHLSELKLSDFRNLWFECASKVCLRFLSYQTSPELTESLTLLSQQLFQPMTMSEQRRHQKWTSVLFSGSRREAILLQGRILQTRSFAEKWATDKFLVIVSANSQSQQSRRFISHLQRNFVIISYAMFRQTSRTDLINSVYPVEVSFCKETLRLCVNPEAFMRPWHQCFSPDDVFEGLFWHNPKERLS